MSADRLAVEAAAVRLGLRVVWGDAGVPWVLGEDLVVVSPGACFRDLVDYFARVGSENRPFALPGD